MVDLSGPALQSMLTPETRAWMSSIARRRDYRDGELVHARGDPETTMEIVVKGQLRLVRIRRDGSQSLVSQIGPGQHIADVLMLAGLPRSHSAFAVGATTVDHYDRAAFDSLLANPEVLRALYRISARRLSTALSMVDDLRTLSREAHLAKLLLAVADGSDGDGVVSAVQEDLASILGVSAMTLAKSLGQLKRAGLIETGYRQVRVPDRARLARWLAEHDPD